MKRPVRIAFTLFASATILIFLVLQRLERAKAISANGDEELAAFAENELRMAYTGMAICAVMLAGGIAMLVTAWVRSRKPGHG